MDFDISPVKLVLDSSNLPVSSGNLPPYLDFSNTFVGSLSARNKLKRLSVYQSSFEKMDLNVEDAFLKEASVMDVNKLRVSKSLIIQDSSIRTVEQLAMFLGPETTSVIENCIIHNIGKEGLIVEGHLQMKNVTILNASRKSVIVSGPQSKLLLESVHFEVDQIVFYHNEKILSRKTRDAEYESVTVAIEEESESDNEPDVAISEEPESDEDKKMEHMMSQFRRFVQEVKRILFTENGVSQDEIDLTNVLVSVGTDKSQSFYIDLTDQILNSKEFSSEFKQQILDKVQKAHSRSKSLTESKYIINFEIPSLTRPKTLDTFPPHHTHFIHFENEKVYDQTPVSVDAVNDITSETPLELAAQITTPESSTISSDLTETVAENFTSVQTITTGNSFESTDTTFNIDHATMQPEDVITEVYEDIDAVSLTENSRKGKAMEEFHTTETHRMFEVVLSTDSSLMEQVSTPSSVTESVSTSELMDTTETIADVTEAYPTTAEGEYTTISQTLTLDITSESTYPTKSMPSVDTELNSNATPKNFSLILGGRVNDKIDANYLDKMFNFRIEKLREEVSSSLENFTGRRSKKFHFETSEESATEADKTFLQHIEHYWNTLVTPQPWIAGLCLFGIVLGFIILIIFAVTWRRIQMK